MNFYFMSAEWRCGNSSSNLVVICKSCRKCYWSSNCVHIIVMDKVIELEDAIKQYSFHLFFFFILPAFGRWHEFWIKYHRLYDPNRFKTPVSSVGQHKSLLVCFNHRFKCIHRNKQNHYSAILISIMDSCAILQNRTLSLF